MNYDAIVLGGGPAGAVTASTLARAGRRVLVLDRSDGGFRGGECLPPNARPVLQRLGLEQVLREGPHLPCYANQSAWGAPDLWEADFLRSPWGHGWHLDRSAFDAMLLDLAEIAGAEIRRHVRFTAADRINGSKEGWRVCWEGIGDEASENATCRFVVDASGQARVFLRQREVEVERSNRQVARVLTFWNGRDDQDSPDTDTRTLLETTVDGWWYTARIPGGRRTVMFFTDPDLSPGADMRQLDLFLDTLADTQFVGERIRQGGYRPCGGVLTRPAASTRACRAVGRGWAAAGDAAMSHDPLSSLGVTTALSGGETVAQALLAALGGDGTALPRYQDSLDRAWDELREESAKYYGMEGRWRHQPYWRRRATAA